MSKENTTTRRLNLRRGDANPFDAIVSPVVPAKKGRSPKLLAAMTDEGRLMVTQFIGKKATLKTLESEVKRLDASIIDLVQAQQVRHARSGNYCKTFEVHGLDDEKDVVNYVTSDRFSTPKDPAVQAQLKELLGEERFAEMFTSRRSISLKPEKVGDLKFLQKVAQALQEANIQLAEAFDVFDVMEAKDGLDEKQYELTPKEHEVFKSMVTQVKPSLR